MSIKRSAYAVACILLLVANASSAASIVATASQATGGIGDIVTVSVHGDFSSLSTIGGGFYIFFDSGHLGFLAFGFSDAANFADDPAFRREPDVLDGELNGIGFGHFDGLGGIFELASIQFEILAAGSSAITLAVNEGGPPSNPGGFFDFQGFPMNVDFVGTQITTIPLPAAVWLLAAAAGALTGLPRRRRTHK